MSNVIDSFNRANSGSLGTADSGQSWSNFGGGGLGISANRAVVTAATSNAGAVIDSGSPNATYSVILPLSGSISGGLIFRYVNGDNFWVVQQISDRLYLRKYVNAEYTDVISGALSFAANDVVEVEANNNNIIVRLNGATIHNITDSALNTGTSGGLLARPSAEYDDFSITNAASGGSATKLAMGQQPVGGAASNILPVPPIVQVLDASNVLVTSGSFLVTATLNVISGSGSLSGTTARNTINGASSFNDLRVSGPGVYTITFTSPGLTSVTTAQFTVVARSNSPYLNLGIDGKDLGLSDAAAINNTKLTVFAGDRRGVTENRLGGTPGNQWAFQGTNLLELPGVLLDSDTFPTRAGMTVHNVSGDAALQALLGGATLATGRHIVVIDNTVEYTGNYVNNWPLRAAGDNLPGGDGVVVLISKAIYDSMPAGSWASTVLPPKKRIANSPTEFNGIKSNLVRFRPLGGTSGFQLHNLAGRTKGWRLIGLWVQPTNGLADINHLFAIGSADGAEQPNAAAAPSNIVIDRCAVDGNGTGDVGHGFELNAANSCCIDSYVGPNVLCSKGPRSENHGICTFMSPGALRVVNNYIAGGSQNFFIGGALGASGPAYDLEVRWNWITRPTWWNPRMPDYDGKVRAVKANFEFKKVIRAVIDSNVNENVYPESQDGAAWLLKSESYGDGATVGGTRDILLLNNYTRNCSIGINIASVDNNDPVTDNTRVRRVIGFNNLYKCALNGWNGDNMPMLMLMNSIGCGSIHETYINDGNAGKAIQLTSNLLPSGARAQDPVLLNSIYDATTYGWKGDDAGSGDIVTTTSGVPWVHKNVVVGSSGSYPAGTELPANRSVVVFEDEAADNWMLHGSGAASPATQLGMVTQPNNTASGVPHSSQPAVEIKDAGGTRVLSASDTVNAELVTVAGSGTAAGTLSKAAVSGLAQFVDLGVNSAGGGTFKWRFTSGSLTLVESAAFTVTAAPAATGLRMVTQPSNIATGEVHVTQPEVEVIDQYNNRFITNSVSVAAQLIAVSGSGSAIGVLSKQAAAGLASFTGLGVTAAGGGTFKWRFSGAGLGTVDSNTFTVTQAPAAPFPASVEVNTQPSISVVDGQPFVQGPVIRVKDQNGATYNAGPVTVKSMVVSGSGQLVAGQQVTTSTGFADFTPNLRVQGLGPVILSFFIDGIPGVQANAFNIIAGSTNISQRRRNSRRRGSR